MKETQSEYICPGLEMPDNISISAQDATKIYEDGAFIARQALEVWSASGSRFIKLPLDYNYEAYAFGGQIRHGKNHLITTEYRYENIEDLAWILDMDYDAGKFAPVFEAVEIVKSKGIVMLRVEGVFSIISALINPMKILRALKKEQNFVLRLMAQMTAIIEKYIHQAVLLGVSIVSYADPVGTIDLVGRNVYKKVIGRYTYILLKQLENDFGQGIMHMCGKCSFALEKCGYLKMLPVAVPEMFYADAVEQSIKTENIRFIGHGCINCEDLMINRLWTLKLCEMNGYIRAMVPEDADAVLKIYGSAIEDGKSTVVNVVPDWQMWNQTYWPQGRFVYCFDQTTVGFVALKPQNDHSWSGVPAFEVSIYVHKSYRNMGIGTALLESVVHFCSDNYQCNMFSHIFSDNIASIRLHKKLGFERVRGSVKKVIHREKEKEIYTYERKYHGDRMQSGKTAGVI